MRIDNFIYVVQKLTSVIRSESILYKDGESVYKRRNVLVASVKRAVNAAFALSTAEG